MKTLQLVLILFTLFNFGCSIKEKKKGVSKKDTLKKGIFKDVYKHSKSQIYADFDLKNMAGIKELDKNAILSYPFAEVLESKDSIIVWAHTKRDYAYNMRYKKENGVYSNYEIIPEENTEVYKFFKNGLFKEFVYIYGTDKNCNRYVEDFLFTTDDGLENIHFDYDDTNIRHLIPRKPAFETELSGINDKIVVVSKTSIEKQGTVLLEKWEQNHLLYKEKTEKITKYSINEPFSYFWHIYCRNVNPKVIKID